MLALRALCASPAARSLPACTSSNMTTPDARYHQCHLADARKRWRAFGGGVCSCPLTAVTLHPLGLSLFCIAPSTVDYLYPVELLG
uniref:Uncharacterized protein n=1 Tax=Ixodes scapularis TaxID=6945 RepID=A0A4D5RVE6_IXOSC